MRKRLLAISLLPLLLVGCNKVSDNESMPNETEGSASETIDKTEETTSETIDKTEETTSETIDKDTYEKESDTTVDKETLYQQFKSGFDAFFSDEQNLTYECQMTMSGVDEGVNYKAITRGKGTHDRENGLFYNERNSYSVDSETDTETLFQNDVNYVGVVDGENMYYEKEGEDKTKYVVDQYYHSLAYEDAMSEWGLNDIEYVFENAASFEMAAAAAKYLIGSLGTTIGCDIANSEQGVTFTIRMEQEDRGNYYLAKTVGGYAFVVKDGFLSKTIVSYAEDEYYPNGTTSSSSGLFECDLEKGFDESLYQTFQDFSSYTPSTTGVKMDVDVFYEDYHCRSINYYLGSDIELDDYMLSCFDGLYYDKDFTIPYKDKKCTSDVTKMYVKLKSTPNPEASIVYELTETTTLFYKNVLPPTVRKEIDAAYLASSTYRSYSWKNVDEDDRTKANEKVTVNGIETTDDGITLQLGAIYMIKHTYSTY